MPALDPHPFDRRGTFTIFGVSIYHVTLAMVMVLWPSGAGATCLLALLRFFHALGAPDGIYFMSATMLVFVTLALLGAFCRLGRIRLAILLPQHLILAGMTWGLFTAGWTGRYLDNTVIPRAHIVNDQLIFLLVFALHFVAIIQRSRDPTG